MSLDLKHLDSQEMTTTVETALGDFEVTFNPGSAKRKWQSKMGQLQRDIGQAAQDGDEKKEEKLNDELTEHLQKLIKDWDLTSEGEKLPVSAETFDEIPLGVQREMFEQVITQAAGGNTGNLRRRS